MTYVFHGCISTLHTLQGLVMDESTITDESCGSECEFSDVASIDTDVASTDDGELGQDFSLDAVLFRLSRNAQENHDHGPEEEIDDSPAWQLGPTKKCGPFGHWLSLPPPHASPEIARNIFESDQKEAFILGCLRLISKIAFELTCKSTSYHRHLRPQLYEELFSVGVLKLVMLVERVKNKRKENILAFVTVYWFSVTLSLDVRLAS